MLTNRNYRWFSTSLPDQFVEANITALNATCRNWQDTNIRIQYAHIIDGVCISLCGSRKAHSIPYLSCNSPTQITNWIAQHGDKYNGRYWETFAKDNGGSGGKSNTRTAIRTSLPPSTFRSISASSGQGSGLNYAEYFKAIQDLADQRLFGLVSITAFSVRPEPEHPPLCRDGIIAGEIIADRCWLVVNGLLRSVYQLDFWHPNQPLNAREIEDWDSRGIHAWKPAAQDKLFEYLRGYLDHTYRDLGFANNTTPERPAMVTGKVALWGDVVEHEFGYRAEYARVKSIDWLYPDKSMLGREAEVLAHLRQIYGV